MTKELLFPETLWAHLDEQFGESRTPMGELM